jgi:hypothetical protein
LGADEVSVDGAAGDVERVGDLGFGQVVPESQEHDGALLHAERGDGS